MAKRAPRSDQPMIRVSLSLPTDVVDWIDGRAETKGLTRAAWICNQLTRACEQHTGSDPRPLPTQSQTKDGEVTTFFKSGRKKPEEK